MKIIHIDMDAFYASVEQRDNPALRGKPVAVGGSAQGRGVVAAASYEARRFGVRSAMSCAQAMRLCPKLTLVRPRIAHYARVSDEIHSVFSEVTSLIEPLSLDEAYLDVTQNHLNEKYAKNVAIYLKEKIRERTGLTASAGVAPNKFVAKIASDYRKPDGLVVIPPSSVLDFIENLPVEKFWGVGPATAKRLHSIGVFNCRDLRGSNPDTLQREIGSYGRFLYDLAFGRDDRPVETHQEPKSRGTETTFEKDVMDLGVLGEVISDQAEALEEELKRMDRSARTVTLKVRYQDFKTITRSQSFPQPFSDRKFISQVAESLLHSKTEAGARPVRLLGISVSGFPDPSEPEQLWLDLPFW